MIEGTEEADLEGKLKHLENVLQECMTQKVPEDQVQRFLARIINLSKRSGFLVGVDHAIFKTGENHIRLLEASLNESNLSWTKKKELLDNLLKMALPQGLNAEVLAQSRNGLSWVPCNSSDQDDSEYEYINTEDKSVMTKKMETSDKVAQTG